MTKQKSEIEKVFDKYFNWNTVMKDNKGFYIPEDKRRELESETLKIVKELEKEIENNDASLGSAIDSYAELCTKKDKEIKKLKQELKECKDEIAKWKTRYRIQTSQYDKDIKKLNNSKKKYSVKK